MGLRFEWDDAKAASNLGKHGVSFEEASTTFGDPLSRTIADPDHYEEEDRFVLLGITAQDQLVVVVHTEQEEDVIRLVSARLATATERRDYEEDKT